ncbi:MAG: hypothetical protein ACR2HY_00665 [Acidimicrobiales bacterium]
MAEDSRGDKRADDVSTLVRDIASMVVAYVKQETLDPIKGLGRFLAFGAAAVVVGGVGLVLLVLGGLRLLQTETGSAFSGHLSFLPYVIALAVCGAIAGAALKAAASPPTKKRTP